MNLSKILFQWMASHVCIFFPFFYKCDIFWLIVIVIPLGPIFCNPPVSLKVLVIQISFYMTLCAMFLLCWQHHIICVQKSRNLIISSSSSPQSNRLLIGEAVFDLFPAFCFDSMNVLHFKYTPGFLSVPSNETSHFKMPPLVASACGAYFFQFLCVHKWLAAASSWGLLFRCHVGMDVAPDLTAVSCFYNSSFHSCIKQKCQTFADDLVLCFLISERDWRVFDTLVMKIFVSSSPAWGHIPLVYGNEWCFKCSLCEGTNGLQYHYINDHGHHAPCE